MEICFFSLVIRLHYDQRLWVTFQSASHGFVTPAVVSLQHHSFYNDYLLNSGCQATARVQLVVQVSTVVNSVSLVFTF